MTTTTEKGQDSYIPALPETSLAQTIKFLSHDSKPDISDTLVQLWAESTEQHAKDDYVQQWRSIQAILNHEVPIRMVQDAMDHCQKISDLEQGNCVANMYDDAANTHEERETRLDQESSALAWIAAQIGWKL